MNNPFAEICERLHNIEGFLLNIDEKLTTPTPLPDTDRWEQGVKVAVEETGLKVQTVYQQISKLPHRKLHGKLYFNRVQLRAYIEREGGKDA
jgi:hypothetical protein